MDMREYFVPGPPSTTDGRTAGREGVAIRGSYGPRKRRRGPQGEKTMADMFVATTIIRTFVPNLIKFPQRQNVTHPSCGRSSDVLQVVRYSGPFSAARRFFDRENVERRRYDAILAVQSYIFYGIPVWLPPPRPPASERTVATRPFAIPVHGTENGTPAVPPPETSSTRPSCKIYLLPPRSRTTIYIVA